MATIVQNNPVDMQPKAAAAPGIVGGAMVGGATQGANAAQATTIPGVPNTATTYDPQTREVNRATETAAGQVESLLAKDNPLMQRARTLATQGMNKRGLVNSSMSQGAGVAAMIDRITPLAQQDAQTYSNQALANQSTINQAGQFNAGEINKFGLQKSDQAFTAGESATNRQFQTSERIGSQAFTSEQNKATQDFQSAQSQLDRAQQVALADKSIEAQQALQAAQQVFQSAQSELDRVNQRVLQESQQIFTAGQNELDRAQQASLAAAAQTFQASQSEKDRAAQLMLADKNITAQQALEQSRQSFQAEQSGLDRAQATSLARESQAFQASQSEKDRATQIMLADKNISAQKALESSRQALQKSESALDRAQQTAMAEKQLAAQKELQTAQQSFSSAQAELDRAQQVVLADKSVAAQQALQTAQQNFSAAQATLDRSQQANLAQFQVEAQKSLQTAQQQFSATQSSLDRTQQESMTRLSNDLNSANVSKTFAANLTLQTSNAINAIAADPNLTPDAKKGAIQNAIDNANYTMQWGSTFYDTTLPKIGMPGSATTPGVVTPGEGAGGGVNRAPAATAADIAEIYQSVLGRAPDAEGLRSWVSSGRTAEEIRAEIGRSEEAVQRGGIINNATQGAATQSGAYKWAQNNGGVDAMYDRIAAFLINNPTPEQIDEAMRTTQISGADIAEARRRMAGTYGQR